MHLPPTASNREHNSFARSRVASATRTRYQVAEPGPARRLLITSGDRVPRTDGNFFCRSWYWAKAALSDQLPASCSPQGPPAPAVSGSGGLRVSAGNLRASGANSIAILSQDIAVPLRPAGLLPTPTHSSAGRSAW